MSKLSSASAKPRALKVGLVLDDSLDKTDGVQQYVLQVGAWLVTQGHQVHYLAGHTKRRDLPNLHSLSRTVNVRFNGNRLSVPLPASKRRIRRLLTAEQFDVLHVQMPYSPLLAGKIMRAASERTAIIATFHILPYSRLVRYATYLLALWSRPSLRRLQQMISVSPAAADFAKATYRCSSIVVPNTFDFHRFAQAELLPLYDDQVVTIMFLGRLVTRKGCLQLLRAVSQIPTDTQSFRVVICGGGPLERQLKTYVETHSLQDIVSFAGRVSEDDKPRYLASADIAVFPSSGGESFGIVLLEAMASGRASVLGGDNPGYRSVLGSRPEQLFNPGDTNQLSLKLQLLISDPTIRKAAADWGKQIAMQYDTSIVGKRLLSVYQDVIAKNNRFPS